MPSPGLDVQSWSHTPLTNGSADPSINFLENQARASLNDSCRAMMAAHAIDRDLGNGTITTGGSAAAQTFASGASYTSMPPAGFRITLKMGFTNTGAFTLNMDAIGAKPVKTMFGSDPGAGTFIVGTYGEFIWDGTTNFVAIQTATRLTPTMQVFTSGSGTYTTPANARTLIIEMIGGGGGGGGSASGNGTTGGTTSFGIISCSGGVNGSANGGIGGAGGTVTGSPTIGFSGDTGGPGMSEPSSVSVRGGDGASGYFGGGGGGGSITSGPGAAGAAPGSGGGGGSNSITSAGSGGGSGAFVRHIIAAPAASYAYAVGAAGASGGSPSQGGAGAAGIIIVTEYY